MESIIAMFVKPVLKCMSYKQKISWNVIICVYVNMYKCVLIFIMVNNVSSLKTDCQILNVYKTQAITFIEKKNIFDIFTMYLYFA